MIDRSYIPFWKNSFPSLSISFNIQSIITATSDIQLVWLKTHNLLITSNHYQFRQSIFHDWFQVFSRKLDNISILFFLSIWEEEVQGTVKQLNYPLYHHIIHNLPDQFSFPFTKSVKYWIFDHFDSLLCDLCQSWPVNRKLTE